MGSDNNAPIALSSEKKDKLDLYFHTFDDDVLGHFSKYLRTEDWANVARAEYGMPLFDVCGELGSFLQLRCFTTLYIGYELPR